MLEALQRLRVCRRCVGNVDRVGVVLIDVPWWCHLALAIHLDGGERLWASRLGCRS